jgi:hypothetical protein
VGSRSGPKERDEPAKPEVQKLAAATLEEAFAGYTGVKTAEGGQDISSVYRSHKEFLASYLVGVESGYDVLDKLARQERPQDPLPYRELFLNADPEKFGPQLKQAIAPIVRDSLIPEFVGRNWKTVRALAVSELHSNVPGGRVDAIDKLVDLYTGDGWAVYINGRMIAETKSLGGMGSGAPPKGAFITTDWFNDFTSGKVLVAAIAFHGPRKDKPNSLNIWFEEMKLPPAGEELLRKSATVIPLLSAAWQDRQDPNIKELRTAGDKFRYDGKFIANPKMLGDWTTMAMTPTIDSFDPAKPTDANRATIKAITFRDAGLS